VSAPDVKRALLAWERMDALMSETRWPTGYRGSNTRTLAIAITWAWLTLPREGQTWDAILDLAGWTDRQSRMHMLRGAVGEDAPRYEPPNSEMPWHRPCEAPMIRRPGLCGKRGTWTRRVTDPATGRWRKASWCNRHREFYEEESAAERLRRSAGTLPKPAPNTGGLLVLHVPSRIWPDMYAWARYGWEPPELGLNPNDWPVLEAVHQYRPPTLKALDGGSETVTLSAPPPLRLVGDAS
jgi:hypothetical protein